ncbi:MAG: DUF2867 domain-containing protein, partial [Chloroflexi bacterium]|nr:DUF2867 domain-containing protein [Chloroflexota bacterium]
MDKREFLRQIPGVADLLDGADEVDIKTVTAPITLRELVAALCSWQPGWVTFLYRVRWAFVRVLGMTQEGIPQARAMRPEDAPMTPGDTSGVFPEIDAAEDRYWIAGASESHLAFWLIIAPYPDLLSDGSTRFTFTTLVRYNRWIGRVYYFIVRPFHHLIVGVLLRSVVRQATKRATQNAAETAESAANV